MYGWIGVGTCIVHVVVYVVLWMMTDDVLCVVRVTMIKVLFIFSLAGTECH